MTTAERKAAQQAEAQRQLGIALKNCAAQAIGHMGPLIAATIEFHAHLEQVSARIGPGPDRPVAHQN